MAEEEEVIEIDMAELKKMKVRRRTRGGGGGGRGGSRPARAAPRRRDHVVHVPSPLPL